MFAVVSRRDLDRSPSCFVMERAMWEESQNYPGGGGGAVRVYSVREECWER